MWLPCIKINPIMSISMSKWYVTSLYFVWCWVEMPLNRIYTSAKNWKQFTASCVLSVPSCLQSVPCSMSLSCEPFSLPAAPQVQQLRNGTHLLASLKMTWSKQCSLLCRKRLGSSWGTGCQMLQMYLNAETLLCSAAFFILLYFSPMGTML